MIAKKYRITSSDFRKERLRVRKPDRTFSFMSTRVLVYASTHAHSRCAVITPLARFTHIVSRNHTRRLVYDALAPYITAVRTPSIDVVCIIGNNGEAHTSSQLQSFFADVFLSRM